MYQYNRKGPKRGVALYSYSAEFGLNKTLEDCFEDLYDMGAHGIEILANTHIEKYPYPTDEWVEKWHHLCEKYEIVPAEYGNWIDSHVLPDRDLTTEESIEMLKRDIRLAHRLGFHVMRTKMPVINDLLEPVENWREIIKGALPLAEKLDVKMCPEIHTPSNLKGKLVTDFVDFIKETGTKNFGLNIDFSVFRTTEASSCPRFVRERFTSMARRLQKRTLPGVSKAKNTPMKKWQQILRHIGRLRCRKIDTDEHTERKRTFGQWNDSI